jgi:hypothetical protein
MLIYSHDIKPDMHQLYSLPALWISVDSKQSLIL